MSFHQIRNFASVSGFCSNFRRFSPGKAAAPARPRVSAAGIVICPRTPPLDLSGVNQRWWATQRPLRQCGVPGQFPPVRSRRSSNTSQFQNSFPQRRASQRGPEERSARLSRRRRRHSPPSGRRHAASPPNSSRCRSMTWVDGLMRLASRVKIP